MGSAACASTPTARQRSSASTISGNGGDGIGFGAATVVSSTVANNALAGINVYRRSTLRSTIVAGDGGPSGDCDTSTVGSQLRVLGTSLIGDVGSCTIVAAAGLVRTGHPLLGPLHAATSEPASSAALLGRSHDRPVRPRRPGIMAETSAAS